MTAAKVKRAPIVCPECQRRTTAKHLDSNGGRCRNCRIPDYDKAEAKRIIGDARGRRGLAWDGVTAEIKSRMHPPAGKTWSVPVVIQHDADRINW